MISQKLTQSSRLFCTKTCQRLIKKGWTRKNFFVVMSRQRVAGERRSALNRKVWPATSFFADFRPPYVSDEAAWMKRSSKFFEGSLDLISEKYYFLPSCLIRKGNPDIGSGRATSPSSILSSCKKNSRICGDSGQGESFYFSRFSFYNAEPGMTTDAIDQLVHQAIVAEHAYPSPLAYRTELAVPNYPKSICTSINEVIMLAFLCHFFLILEVMCHGIPDSTVLLDGDIICIDVTVYFNGFHGDTAKTFYVGKCGLRAFLSSIHSIRNHPKDVVKLVSICEVAVLNAIKQCGPGVPFSVIGKTIE